MSCKQRKARKQSFFHSGKVSSSGECGKFDPDLLYTQPRPSEGLGRALVQVLKVVHVVAHCDEEVEEHPAPGGLSSPSAWCRCA